MKQIDLESNNFSVVILSNELPRFLLIKENDRGILVSPLGSAIEAPLDIIYYALMEQW